MSSLSLKYFVILENDEVRSLPIARLNRLNRTPPQDNVPELAGQRVRTAEVVVQRQGKKLEQVVRAIFGYKQFLDDGTIDRNRQMEDMGVLVEAGLSDWKPERGTNVIEAGAKFAQRRRDHSVMWKPNSALEEHILDCALGIAKCKRI